MSISDVLAGVPFSTQSRSVVASRAVSHQVAAKTGAPMMRIASATASTVERTSCWRMGWGQTPSPRSKRKPTPRTVAM